MKNEIKIANPGKKLTEEATEWFLRIYSDEIAAGDFSSWRDWINRSPAHAEAFDSVSEFWQQSEQVNDLPWPSESELEQDHYDGKAALPVFQHSDVHNSQRSWILASAQVAAVLVLSFGLLFVAIQDLGFPAQKSQIVYETGIAEHKAVDLNDGSQILLGAKSKILIDYTLSERNITLKSGEAFFDVAKDETRPFIVTAGLRSIEAVGTSFNINLNNQDTAVSVIEGVVSISVSPSALTAGEKVEPVPMTPLFMLNAGQELVASTSGFDDVVRPFNADAVTSWRIGRHVFVGKPLETVIANLNRYSDQKIVIAEDEIKGVLFTGTVFNDNISDWLDGLDKAFNVRIINVKDDDLILIASSLDSAEPHHQ